MTPAEQGTTTPWSRRTDRFVGSLPPSDHPDLLAIPDRDFRPSTATATPAALHRHHHHRVGGDPPRGADALGEPARQAVRGLDQTLATARRRLTELAARLARGHTRRDRTKVEAEIAAIRKPRWVADIIAVTLTGEQPADCD